MKRWLPLIAALGLLAGCAQQPRRELTREQWLDTTTRIYPGYTREQVIKAAEQVLRLADGDDFRFAYDETGFRAERAWMMYLLIAATSGTDYWTFSTESTPQGIKASAVVSTTTQNTMPMQTVGGNSTGWTAATGATMGGGVAGTAIYEVFWARVDYLLGLRPAWMSCAESDAHYKARTTWGDNVALCNPFNVTDATPSAPLYPPR